jgi:4-diphosphocytidyl-2-C-methyl-D-erythritol kinase
MADVVRVVGRGTVNLFLRVGRRRDDGYHDIETLFHAIELADEVEIRRTTGRDIVLEGSITEHVRVAPEKNLAVRAARQLLSRAGEGRLGLAIRVEKRLPVAAGLGGGSADAAAVLVGLNVMLDHPFDGAGLNAIGRALGADVPFCIAGGLAEGVGIGDRLVSHAPAEFELVVVQPPVEVSTAWAYAAVDRSASPGIDGSVAEVLQGLRCGAATLAGRTGNDFERVVFPEHPAVPRACDALVGAGAAWAMMSGSGSAVFGVFAGEAEARLAAERLASELPGHRVIATRSAARGAEVLR